MTAWVFGVSPWIATAILVVCCNPYSDWLQFLRPYAAVWAVGCTLQRPDTLFSQLLKNRLLVYCATVSYALYVIHGPLRTGWFEGTGTIDRYLVKRPLTFALTFALAHLSTFYWEAWWIKMGRKWTTRAPVMSRSDGAVEAPIPST